MGFYGDTLVMSTVCYGKWPSWNNWYTRSTWWFSIVVLNFPRGTLGVLWGTKRQTWGILKLCFGTQHCYLYIYIYMKSGWKWMNRIKHVNTSRYDPFWEGRFHQFWPKATPCTPSWHIGNRWLTPAPRCTTSVTTISGWWLRFLPLWKIWVRQLGWWHSKIFLGK